MNLHLYRIGQAAPHFRLKAMEFHRQAERVGYNLLVVRCYATPAEQFAKWRQGRELDQVTGVWQVVGPIVTRAMPGSSSHEVVTLDGQPASLGVDFVPVDPRGRAMWNPGQDVWRALYAIASHCGLDSYGDNWGAEMKGDPGHFQEPGFHGDAFVGVMAELGLRMPNKEEIGLEV